MGDLMSQSYKTLSGRGEAEILERRSRFMALALPVEGEEEAGSVLAEVRKKHSGANHNVYAYITGKNGEHIRCSDDGEPSGTAGAPVLAVLKGQSITNAMVIVTRYFGGTLLGGGGLVRAYSLAAKEAVLAAGVAERILYDIYILRIAYPLLSKFQYEFGKRGYVILDAIYAADITLTVQTESAKSAEFIALAASLSGGAAEAVFEGQCYK